MFNVSFPENISALSHLSQFEWSVLIAKHETKLLIEILQILCLIILFQTKRVDEAKCLFGSISYDILKWDDFLKAVASISQKKGSERIRDASDPSSYDVCCSSALFLGRRQNIGKHGEGHYDYFIAS